MVKKLKTGFEGPGGAERAFAEFARITIQIQMKKRDAGYRELTELFNERFHETENERNMRNKIARGTFSAAFFLMCMRALGANSLEITPEDMSLHQAFRQSRGSDPEEQRSSAEDEPNWDEHFRRTTP